MNCNIVMSKIDLYFENRLWDTEIYTINKHLEVCKSCRDEYKQMENLFNMLSTHQVALPPIDFTKNVMKEVSNKCKNRNRFPTSLSRLAISLVATGILFISLNIFSLDNNFDRLTEHIYSSSLNFNQKIMTPFNKLTKGLDYLLGYWSN